VVNSPEAKAALKILVDSVREGWGKAITSGYINQNFGKGTYGFSTDTSAGYKYYQRAAKFDLGLATLPGKTADRPGYAVVQGTNLIVFRSASEAQKKAAAAFLNFVVTPEVQAIFSRPEAGELRQVRAPDPPVGADSLRHPGTGDHRGGARQGGRGRGPGPGAGAGGEAPFRPDPLKEACDRRGGPRAPVLEACDRRGGPRAPVFPRKMSPEVERCG